MAQLLVVVGGGVLIGALLVLLAFPDATPVGPPVLLGGAGVLAALTTVLALRLGRVPAKPPARKRPTKKKPAKKTAARKPTEKPARKPTKKAVKKPAKKAAKKTASRKKAAPKKPAAQGRGRR